VDASSKAALSRLERLSAVGRAAASFAHEVRGPLHVIASTAELALDHPLPETELRAGLETILRNARQATGAAQALLDFATQPAGPQGPCDLARAAETQLRLLDKLLVKQGVALTSALRPAPATRADARLAESVIHHLLVNALDAMPRGGTLRVALEPAAGWAVLTVADSGKGMDPELLAKAGDPFFTTKEHGTGLGLFVIRRLLDECGGSLELTSAPGRGTTAVVRFPAP
jgi:signal transduction histidine kinase